MSWLRAIPFLFTLLAFVLQPASASAFGPAHPQARVGAFELVALASVYAAAGAGCPQLKLTPDQEAQRRERDVFDWCHWTYAALKTGVARSDLRETWFQRWAASAARTGKG